MRLVSRRLVTAVLLLTGYAAGQTALADLTAAQQKTLTDAQGLLKRAVTNLELAQQSAGTGTPKGSKARLALVRLQSAQQSMPPVHARLEQLPADDETVMAFRQQVATVEQAMAELEGRLTGKPAPTPEPAREDMGGGDSGKDPAPTPPPAETPGGKKLDYRQEEQFRNARFKLREISGQAAALKEFSGKVAEIEDVTGLDHRLMAQAVNTVALARKRIGEFHTHFDPLPADGRGVPELAAQFKSDLAEIDAADKILAPRWEQLARLIDPASYPELTADYDRLRELSGMFSDTNVFLNDRTRAAGLLEQMAPARKEADRILAAYAVLVRQKTDMGEKLMKQHTYFGSKLESFQAAVAQQKTQLPNEIAGHLAEARQYAEEAVAEKKPLFFTGGIPQRIDWAKEKIALLTAIDAGAGAQQQAELDRLQAQLKQQQESLREQIIAGNDMPADRYRGADREALVKRATDKWKQREPKAEVLAARIPAENWKREVMWRSQNTGSWYKIDRSKLQVQLLVAVDDKLAVIRPINLWTNHISNDELTATIFHGEDDELLPGSYLLRTKIK